MPEQINSAQALAIAHAYGPVQVLAGPGSGKTYLTIRRIRHLICHHGISPDKILVITFTKAAALEMEQRFLTLTEGKYKAVRFGTFHAVFFQILIRSGYSESGLSIATAADKIRYLTHILKMLGVKENDIFPELIEELLKKISIRKTVPETVSGLAANEVIEKETIEIEAAEAGECGIKLDFNKIYEEYGMQMKAEHKLDFDDMILLCGKMFDENKKILTYWQQKFSHILVDEFQDIGSLQYRVIKKLAQPEDNLFVVGDDDQSIYGFRGAGPGIMKKFMSDYPKGLQVTLDMNYRSTEEIVKAASLLIADNKNRFAKQLKAAGKEGGKAAVHSFSSKDEEYSYLVQCLGKMPLRELSDTAVIFRTNAQTAALARILKKEKIPFYIKAAAENIFNCEAAKDILAYIRFANDYYNGKEKAGKRKDMLRIMNKPYRCIQRNALADEFITKEKLIRFYGDKPYMQEKINRFFEELKRIAALRPYLAVNYIRKVIGYDNCIKEALETADRLQETAVKLKKAEDWLRYISDAPNNIKYIEDKDDKAQAVRLITMHGSKGLEYGHVFLPDISKANIPSRKAMTQELVEEERRLFYVAMTRAKRTLEILYYGEPSPFLHRLEKGCGHHGSTAGTSMAGITR